MNAIDVFPAAAGVHAEPAAILLINPSAEDRALLRLVLRKSGRRICEARNFREALAALCRERMSVVICRRRLSDGNWKDVLGLIAPLPEPPCLIVTDSNAEDGFWAEVLNLGGYDVLMEPLCQEEVSRVVALACDQWDREYHGCAPVERKPAERELVLERKFSHATSGR